MDVGFTWGHVRRITVQNTEKNSFNWYPFTFTTLTVCQMLFRNQEPKNWLQFYKQMLKEQINYSINLRLTTTFFQTGAAIFLQWHTESISSSPQVN